MHCPCYQFFASTRFSEYQNVGIGGSDFLYSVGGEPLVVNWGMAQDVADPPKEPLAEFFRRPVPKAELLI